MAKNLNKSIIVDDMNYCMVCGSNCVEVHHCIFGKNRKNSDKYGLIVPLCPEHHRGNYSPHMNREFDLELKILAQRKFLEKHGTKEDFIRIFGKAYE